MNYENKIEQIDKLYKKIQSFRPISKDALKQIKEYFRIGLTYSSNAIEGNTLTETETKIVLEDGLTIAGKYRKVPVTISGTDYLPPAPGKVPALMKKFLAKVPAMRKKLHPVVFAAKLHEEIVNIHPFVDGNGRTARLLMNLALFQAGYPITVIPPVVRGDYIAFIKRSQTSTKDDSDFINFVSCMVYESSKDYLRLLKHMSEK